MKRFSFVHFELYPTSYTARVGVGAGTRVGVEAGAEAGVEAGVEAGTGDLAVVMGDAGVGV